MLYVLRYVTTLNELSGGINPGAPAIVTAQPQRPLSDTMQDPRLNGVEKADFIYFIEE